MGQFLDVLIIKLLPGRSLKATTRVYTRLAEWEMDPENDQGNAWRAADDMFMAKISAKATGNQELIAQTEEKAKEITFGGYKPLNSKNPSIRIIAWHEYCRKEIKNLCRDADELAKLGQYSQASKFIEEAAKAAEKIEDYKLAKNLREAPKSWGQK